jgi:hypothetical protein
VWGAAKIQYNPPPGQAVVWNFCSNPYISAILVIKLVTVLQSIVSCAQGSTTHTWRAAQISHTHNKHNRPGARIQSHAERKTHETVREGHALSP